MNCKCCAWYFKFKLFEILLSFYIWFWDQKLSISRLHTHRRKRDGIWQKKNVQQNEMSTYNNNKKIMKSNAIHFVHTVLKIDFTFQSNFFVWLSFKYLNWTVKFHHDSCWIFVRSIKFIVCSYTKSFHFNSIGKE